MSYRTLDQLDVRGKRVLVRVDFNVPMKDGRVTDDTRIRAALPTIQYLRERGASVLLVSHLGRPKGQPDPKYSLKPVASHLAQLIHTTVPIADDVVGPSAQALAASLEPGSIALLENVRFEPGEEKNDPDLARRLAALADVYVNDAFGAAHRAHASTEGVARLLPSAAGLLMQRELEALQRVTTQPEHPMVLLLGGAKISDKIGVIRQFMLIADSLLIGGAMANTFLKAEGFEVGASLVEDDSLELARELRAEAERSGRELLVPTDVVVAQAATPDALRRTAAVSEVHPDEAIYDIGVETIAAFAERVKTARMVVWNGPMGLFEVPPFDRGTRAMAQAIADSAAFSVVGGGDSVAALQQSGLAERISHISTGGGATLEFLEGKKLPGVAALEDAG